MARYIDVDKIDFSILKDASNRVLTKMFLLNQPTADVQEVKHAYWEPIISHFHGKPTGKYYCSNCRRVETRRSFYCPDCGAKMKVRSRI